MQSVMRCVLRPLFLVLLILGSCESPTGSGAPGPPARMDIVSGSDQEGTVGAELPEPLVVNVQDEDGRPVPGQVVNFVVIAGGGKVFAGTAHTNEEGEARERWTLGTVASDSQQVEARAVDPATGEELVFAIFRATARPDVPAAITALGPAAREGEAGVPLSDSLAARVTDRYGNPVPQTAVVWTVRRGGGSISPENTLTDTAGVSRALWTLGTHVDSAQVAEAAAGLSTITSFTATAQVPSIATLVKVSGDGQSGAVGTTLPDSLVVAVRLPDGSGVPGVPVSWIGAAKGGPVTPETAITDANGRVSAQWRLGTVATPFAVTATADIAGRVQAAQFLATVLPGAAAHLDRVAGDAQRAAPGAALPDSLSVRVTDSYGNPVPDVSVAWTVASGGGTISPTSRATDAQGIAKAQWTMGTAVGTDTARAAVEGLPTLSFTATAGGAIRVSIGQPRANALVGDTLSIVASVTSQYETSSVVGAVGDRQTSLAYSDGAWRGRIPLRGLERGSQTLTVTSTDIQGSSVSASVPFRYDLKPELTVSFPLSATVIRNGSVRAAASCSDDDLSGCSVEVWVGGAMLVQARDHLDTDISLSSYEGRVVPMEFRVTDSAGQRASTQRSVFVESSTRLTEIATVGGPVWDVDAGRLLYIDESSGNRVLKIRDRASGNDATVMGAPDNVPQVGYLTPGGALFSGQSGDILTTMVYEWRDGSLLNLGHLDSPNSLTVAGRWAIWSERWNLTRRDLVTGSNTLVATDAANVDNDVAPNGDVAYWSVGGYQVFRYRNGATTQLTNDTGLWNTYVVTDGMNVIYRKHTPCCQVQTYRIAVFGASGERILSDHGLHGPAAGLDFRANNGWIAYTKPSGGVLQVWTVSPDGLERQVTHLGTDSRIAALGSNGEVVFVNGSRRYLSVPGYTASPVDIGADWVWPWPSGTPNGMLWRDGRLLVLIGRSVFEVNF